MVPNLYPALAPRETVRRFGRGRQPERDGNRRRGGAFASSGDPLLESRRAGEADLFVSRPANGAHEVIVNAPSTSTAMAELDEEQFAAAVETWRERMRAHDDAAYVQLIVNEGGGAGASLEHTHAQLYALPFVPAAVARERERAGAYAERTAGGGAAQRRPGRGGAAPRAPGRDRRRGGADLPLGVALSLRAARRAPPRSRQLRGGHRRGGDDPHRAAHPRRALRRLARAQPLGTHRPPRRRAASTGTSTSPPASRSRRASSSPPASTSTPTHRSKRQPTCGNRSEGIWHRISASSVAHVQSTLRSLRP